MTIEQHAEAADREINITSARDAFAGLGVSPVARSNTRKEIIARHMQDAIDEAAAPLRGTIAAQDERERRAGERCGVSHEQHGCEWPEWVADEVLKLKARIAALEGLGPLIEEFADCGIVMANAIHTKSPERQKRASERRREALAKINAILKGGAS